MPTLAPMDRPDFDDLAVPLGLVVAKAGFAPVEEAVGGTVTVPYDVLMIDVEPPDTDIGEFAVAAEVTVV